MIALAALLCLAAQASPEVEALWQRGARVEALERMEAELAARPDDALLRRALVTRELGVSRFQAALAHAEPLGEAGHAARGRALYFLGRYEEALEFLAADDPALVLLRVESLRALGRLDEADALLPAVERLFGADDARYRLLVGRKRLREGDARGAAAEFRAVLATRPLESEAHFGLGRALVKLGEREEGLAVLARHRALVPLLDALDFAQRGVALAPTGASNLAALAEAWAALVPYDESARARARATYADAARWARADEVAPIALRRARWLAELEREPGAAVTCLEDALARQEDVRLHVRRGLPRRARRADAARAHLRARARAAARRPRDRGAAGAAGRRRPVTARAAAAVLVGLAACGGEAPAPVVRPVPAPTSASADDDLRFVDVTERSGLTFRHDAGISEERQLPETMGAGAALFDADEDGDLDLYLVQSGPLPLAPERAGAPPNELWLNEGGLRFRDATAASGAAAHRGYGMGVAVGDVDGDAHDDLYVTNLGPDVLLVGDGAARFADATAAAGLGDERWTAGAVFFDPDADGDLDLYVTAYLEVDLAHPLYCGERRPGWRSYCHPDAYPGLADRYWRNDGRGRFHEASAEAGFHDTAGKGLGAIAGDFDDDGDLDLYVANDSVENRFWFGDGRGGFEDGTLLTGTGVNAMGMTEAGMGLASGDVDGDGRLDLYVTNFDDESNTLYRNDGDGLFTDVTARAGLEGSSRLPVGFGAVMADLDDDGDLDLAVTNGHIIHNIHLYHDGKTWAQLGLCYAGDGAGGFRDVSRESGDLCARPRVGRGLYDGDLDGDGDLDLLVTECNGAARVFENPGATPARVELEGLPRGTRVTFELADGRRLVREAGPQPSYFGSTAPAVRCPLPGVRALAVRVPGEAATRRVEGALGAGRYRARLSGADVVLERRGD
ncbi:MAG: VCBS repeat-containing protein [Planctomycetes bacterium]|nr:VCBS repeat-containing protein [Planctomycetota bacterium]